MIAIIDYDMGNKHSVFNAFDYLGIDAVVTRDAEVIKQADRIVLPGVGAFGQSMENLRDMGLEAVLREAVFHDKKPFMGICLGMQVLAQVGLEKGTFKGLGWIEGTVRFLGDRCAPLKVPHVGWNEIVPSPDIPMFKGLRKDKNFYFVHSYYFDVEHEEQVAATCEYGFSFPCAVLKDNVFATQFHPEKSQKNGLIVLENFANWSV